MFRFIGWISCVVKEVIFFPPFCSSPHCHSQGDIISAIPFVLLTGIFFIRFHYCDSDTSYIHFIMLPNYLMVILLKISLSQIIRVISPGSKACLLSHHVSWRSRSIVNISQRSGFFFLVFTKGPIFSFHGYVVTRSC